MLPPSRSWLDGITMRTSAGSGVSIAAGSTRRLSSRSADSGARASALAGASAQPTTINASAPRRTGRTLVLAPVHPQRARDAGGVRAHRAHAVALHGRALARVDRQPVGLGDVRVHDGVGVAGVDRAP